MWFLPIAIMVTTIILAIPLSRYMAWIMEGKYRAPQVFRWFEQRLEQRPAELEAVYGSLLVFNIVMFVFGYLVLALQPWMPLNPDGKGMLSPTTIFQQRHLVHDEHQPPALLGRPASVHTSARSSSASRICLCRPQSDSAALAAIIRALRSDANARQLLSSTCGGLWSTCSCRSPSCIGLLFMQQGSPMTFKSAVAGLDPRTGRDGHDGQRASQAADDRGRAGGSLRCPSRCWAPTAAGSLA